MSSAPPKDHTDDDCISDVMRRDQRLTREQAEGVHVIYGAKVCGEKDSASFESLGEALLRMESNQVVLQERIRRLQARVQELERYEQRRKVHREV